MTAQRHRPKTPPAGASPNLARQKRRLWIGAVCVLLAAAGVFALNRKTNPASSTIPGAIKAPPALGSNAINTAVMVTVELDFGGRLPSIAEALKDIERRHEPEFGTGRVFAILDAYGGPTPDGKKLHMSMHVSMEKPGTGSLVFKRTGEVLWRSRILLSTNISNFSATALNILLDDGSGKLLTVDGSNNPESILDAGLKELGRPVRDLWLDGTERELTFLYSACGCPVKVKSRRTGDRTVRTSDMPVIFPDDPAVVSVITRLMRW